MSLVQNISSSSLKNINKWSNHGLFDPKDGNEKESLRTTCQPKIDHSSTFKKFLRSAQKSAIKILTNDKEQIYQLRRQNQQLRNEINWLKQIIGNKSNIRFQQLHWSVTSSRVSMLQSQKFNLKRIVEKSYNYIKDMQLEGKKMAQDLSQGIKQIQRLKNKVKNLQSQNRSLRINTRNLSAFHSQEVKLLNNRMILAQKKIQQMMDLTQINQKQWASQKIINFKKN